MKDVSRSRRTYYDLVREDLVSHPKLFSILLIFALISLTALAAYLVSDILSFSSNANKKLQIPGFDIQEAKEKINVLPNFLSQKVKLQVDLGRGNEPIKGLNNTEIAKNSSPINVSNLSYKQVAPIIAVGGKSSLDSKKPVNDSVKSVSLHHHHSNAAQLNTSNKIQTENGLQNQTVPNDNISNNYSNIKLERNASKDFSLNGTIIEPVNLPQPETNNTSISSAAINNISISKETEKSIEGPQNPAETSGFNASNDINVSFNNNTIIEPVNLPQPEMNNTSINSAAINNISISNETEKSIEGPQNSAETSGFVSNNQSIATIQNSREDKTNNKIELPRSLKKPTPPPGLKNNKDIKGNLNSADRSNRIASRDNNPSGIQNSRESRTTDKNKLTGSLKKPTPPPGLKNNKEIKGNPNPIERSDRIASAGNTPSRVTSGRNDGTIDKNRIFGSLKRPESPSWVVKPAQKNAAT